MENEIFKLRYGTINDIEDIFNNYANDDEVTKYLTWPTHKNVEETKSIFERWTKEEDILKKYHYFIELKETYEVIGSITVCKFVNGVPEIGYVLGRKYWNRGIMTSATKMVIDQLFNDGFKKITINAEVANIGSNKVISKCGFKFVKQDYVDEPLKDRRVLCNFYEISK